MIDIQYWVAEGGDSSEMVVNEDNDEVMNGEKRSEKMEQKK